MNISTILLYEGWRRRGIGSRRGEGGLKGKQPHYIHVQVVGGPNGSPVLYRLGDPTVAMVTHKMHSLQTEDSSNPISPSLTECETG